MINEYDFESLASRFINSFDKSRDIIMEMEDNLLKLLYVCFENEVSDIENGKKPPINVLQVSLDSWKEDGIYSKVTKLVDELEKIDALSEFEKQYCLWFRFDQIADRDSYADPKHYILHIKWDYRKYLKNMERRTEPPKTKKLYLLK